ncbi:hypothetical protein PSTG_16102 [Puccinia striiformis f. sp. tritici PST-78]|uniref:Uncharacterized protein n=1 Tax=Puccinia striiformis f. sp. tritici PST-78 TaxID=1165861 RepID=A0A0L0UTS6_9BASI|nr:hypothetical protein PSTG_16102 [Puccinia striiformis f. sp. tritici PST-78]
MQSTLILSCLAFLALSHQAISMEAGKAIAGAETVEAPVVKQATSSCRGCRCGHRAKVVKTPESEAITNVASEEIAGVEATKTAPAVESKDEPAGAQIKKDHI